MKSLDRQSNYHFSYSIDINSSCQEVWTLLTNVERWSEWDTELKGSKLFDEFALGAKGELSPKKGPKLKFHISQFENTESYTFITKLPIGKLEIKRSIEEKNKIVGFTDDIRFTGPLMRLYGFLLGKTFKSALPKVMHNFKKIAEEQ